MNDPTPWSQRQNGFFDDTSMPANAARLTWSDEKLRELRPEFFGLSGFIYSLFVRLGRQFNDKQFIHECIDGGDARAAVVVSIQPLTVAAYSDELDCVVLLRFPDHFVAKYGLNPGTKLLTVNSYGAGSTVDDLTLGPGATGNWDNMIPTIAEFASDDMAQINQLKQQIPPEEWRRAATLGMQLLQSPLATYRDGRPFFCSAPLHAAREYETQLRMAQNTRMGLLGAAGAGLLCVLFCCGGFGLFGGRHRGLGNQGVPVAQPQFPNPAAQPGSSPPVSPAISPVTPPPGFPAQLTPTEQPSAPSTFPPGFPQPPSVPTPGAQETVPAFFDATGKPTRFPPNTVAVSANSPLRPGTKVWAIWGGSWYRGVIVEPLPNGGAKVTYSDGFPGTLTAEQLRLDK